VPLGADTAFSSPTELSGIGIASVKPAKSVAPMMGAKRTIVEKYERIEMEPYRCSFEGLDANKIPLGSCEVVSLSKRVICKCE